MFDSHTVHAVVLTGGRSSRMGGRHKPGIPVGGRTVIDRTLTTLWSVVPSAKVLIAGSDEGLSERFRQHVTVVREDPPFSGPVAGVAAAVEALSTSEGVTLLLGGDLPFLSAATMRRLLQAALDGASVVSCRDETGHLQYLCSGWRTAILREQVAAIADPTGVPLRALFSGLEPELIHCDPEELRDIDTPEDLARAVSTADGRPIPEALLSAVEDLRDVDGGELGLTPQHTAEILEFARAVKYSPSDANPVVAAFLAGQLAGAHGESVADALRSVLGVVDPAAELGDVHEPADHLARGSDILSVSLGEQDSGEIHGHGSG